MVWFLGGWGRWLKMTLQTCSYRWGLRATLSSVCNWEQEPQLAGAKMLVRAEFVRQRTNNVAFILGIIFCLSFSLSKLSAQNPRRGFVGFQNFACLLFPKNIRIPTKGVKVGRWRGIRIILLRNWNYRTTYNVSWA